MLWRSATLKTIIILFLLFALSASHASAISDSSLVKIGLSYGANSVETAVFSLEQSIYASGGRLSITNGASTYSATGDTLEISTSSPGIYIRIDKGALTEKQWNEIEAIIMANNMEYTNPHGQTDLLFGPYGDIDSANTAKTEIGALLAAYPVILENVSLLKSDYLVLYDRNSQTSTNSVIWMKFYQNTKIESSSNLSIYNTVTYRGSFYLYMNQSASNPSRKLNVINEIPISNYLYGVLPREMAYNWPLEALKAQALAARTYLAANMNKHSVDGFNVCNLQHCQVYGGYSTTYEALTTNSRIAVDQTDGLLIKYEGAPISAVYSSNSGGRTESSANAWNSSPLRYLPVQDDLYSVGMPAERWQYTVDVSTLLKKLSSYRPDDILDIFIEEYTSSGRAKIVSIFTPTKKISVSASSFRSLFDTTKFRSNYFTVIKENVYTITTAEATIQDALAGLDVISAQGTEKIVLGGMYSVITSETTHDIIASETTFFFDGKGFGHGVGMSQWGAYNMARYKGMSYKDIIGFYYPGTTILK